MYTKNTIILFKFVIALAWNLTEFVLYSLGGKYFNLVFGNPIIYSVPDLKAVTVN